MTDVPTPWERANVSKRARRSENDAAKLSGGRRVSGSGNRREKGDIRAGIWRIEDKFTDAESFRLEKAVFDKITAEALHTPPGCLPQMRITMPGLKLRVLREEDFLWLMAAAEGSDVTDS